MTITYPIHSRIMIRQIRLKYRKEQTGSQVTLRYYKLSYVIALSAIAILSIISQLLVQNHLKNSQHDSHLINYAARLRTNSQSLFKYALLIESGRDIKTNREDFRTTLMQWKNTHNSLISGNDFLSLPVNKNEDMRSLFAIIDTPFKSLITNGEEICAVIFNEEGYDNALLSEKISEMLKYEKSYFLGMEMIVFDYDLNYRLNIDQLKKIELWIFFLVLVALCLEVIFIFTPLDRRITTTFDDLILAQNDAIDLADKLRDANLFIEKNHTEIRDINFALEKATHLVKTDEQGNIIYANDKYCHLTKYKMGDLLTKPLFYNKKTGKSNIIYDHINNHLVNKEIWQGEICDKASDGSVFWLETTLMPIVGRDKKPYQYLMLASNITERKNTLHKLQLLMEEKIKRQEEITKISALSMVAGQDKERKRVAAEIHDSIGQMLTSLRMRMEMGQQESDQNNEMMNEAQDILRNIIAETRRIMAELLPSVLEDFGLEPAVTDLLQKIKQNNKIEINTNIDLLETRKSKNIELGIYRVLQESVNNVIKHADATIIDVNLSEDAEFIVLEIKDNGHGFIYNDKDTLEAPIGGNSYGLSNMNERANVMDADLHIISNLGKGTTIKLEVPTI